MHSKPAIKRALISTYNKTGLVEFAQALSSMGVEIIATGGTAQLLEKSHIKVIEISHYTEFPEIMGGRVKTLHPKIFGGLLRREGIDDVLLHQENILPIDLLIVNLYPFEETISRPTCTLPEAIEQIDIGGPSLLRAAAKNHHLVTVITDPSDYPALITEIKNNGATDLLTRQKLAQKVFEYTSHYDAVIANYFSKQIQPPTSEDFIFPQIMTLHLKKIDDLRYGENPHQQAAFYSFNQETTTSLAHAKQRQGKGLSYNNFVDSDAAIQCLKYLHSDQPACVIIKHATPCGVALGHHLKEAYQFALRTDPESAFGGIIAVNQPLDKSTAEEMIKDQFIEVIIAPHYHEEALKIFSGKPNLRVLSLDKIDAIDKTALDFRSISGGFLLQEKDQVTLCDQDFKVASQRSPNEKEKQDLIFAWKTVAMVKSNAIVYAKNQATLGIGTGQTSRVFSAKIAELKAKQAHLSLQGAVMASDAFFPFKDSIELAATFGISAIIQPGGSRRDAEVIEAANSANIAMVLTGSRHFRH